MASNARNLSRLLGSATTVSSSKLAPEVNQSITSAITLAESPPTQQINTSEELPLSGNDIGDQAYVAETGRMYIWTGSGWYNIALINTNPSFDSGGSPEASYRLDSAGGNPLVIQLSASDPEEVPIQWSYIASDSAQYFANITQDSSVFTITAKDTGIIQQYDSNGGTFSVTFKASDGVNLATALSEFTLNLSPIQFIDLSGGTNNSNVLYTAPNGTTVSVSSNQRVYNSNYLLEYMFNNTPEGGAPGAGYYLGYGNIPGQTGSITLNFNSSLSYLSHVIVYPWTRSDSFSNITSIQKYNGSEWITVYGDQGLNSTNTPIGTSYRYDFNTTDQQIRFNLRKSGNWGISMNEILVYGTPAF